MPIQDAQMSLKMFAPELVIVVSIIGLFLLDAFVPRIRQTIFPFVITILTCIVAALWTFVVSSEPTLFFSGALANDPFSGFFRYLFFFSCGVSAYLTLGSKEIEPIAGVEFNILLLCVTFGLCLMAAATNILTLYLGIETVSIVSFVLAGFNRDNLKSNEASFKYFVFGALASGLMIYGFSLLYGMTNSLQYHELSRSLLSQKTDLFLLILMGLTIYAGFAYKISAFPMHFWTPDVYEGSPVPVATFFSVGPKAAGFAALIRFIWDLYSAGQQTGQIWITYEDTVGPFIGVISALTMSVGNLCAIAQTNVKRLLAYSSIAHVGYILMGLVSLRQGMGLEAVLFYLVAYCAMNLGAFWVVGIVSNLKGGEDLHFFRGIGWNNPILGVCMAIFLFSLTGIPLFAGFIGKFLLFSTVLQMPGYLWLAILGVLNSVISLYYYAKIIREMWLERPAIQTPPMPIYQGLGLLGLALPTVGLGLYFSPVLQFVAFSLAKIL